MADLLIALYLRMSSSAVHEGEGLGPNDCYWTRPRCWISHNPSFGIVEKHPLTMSSWPKKLQLPKNLLHFQLFVGVDGQALKLCVWRPSANLHRFKIFFVKKHKCVRVFHWRCKTTNRDTELGVRNGFGDASSRIPHFFTKSKITQSQFYIT